MLLCAQGVTYPPVFPSVCHHSQVRIPTRLLYRETNEDLQQCIACIAVAGVPGLQQDTDVSVLSPQAAEAPLGVTHSVQAVV